MGSSLLNGLKHFAISLAVLVLTAVVSALANFHPTDQVGYIVWSVSSALIIGGITTAIHWLQAQDALKKAGK